MRGRGKLRLVPGEERLQVLLDGLLSMEDDDVPEFRLRSSGGLIENPAVLVRRIGDPADEVLGGLEPLRSETAGAQACAGLRSERFAMAGRAPKRVVAERTLLSSPWG